MHRLAWMTRAVRLLCLAYGVCAATAGTALAQAAGPQPTTAGKGGSWVLAYALVILGVGLGLLVVCNSSRRSDHATPRSYDEP